MSVDIQTVANRVAHTRRRVNKRRPPTWTFLVLGLLLGLVGGPTLTLFFGAMQSKAPGLPGSEFTLKSILKVYASDTYLVSLFGTLAMAVAVGALAVIFGALVAWILARTDLPHRRLFEIGFIVPLFTAPFLGAYAWTLIASPRSGLINVNLRWILGTDATFVDVMNVGGLIFVLLLYFAPYTYLIVSSALKNMDPGLEEASYLNGRGVLSTAWKITLRIVSPSLAAGFLFISIIATGVFAVPEVLGLNISGFQPLAMRVYRTMQVYPSDPPLGAALGTLLFWFTFAGIYLYRRAVRNSSRFVTISGRATRARRVKLGKWKWLVGSIFWLYMTLTILLPYSVLFLVSLTPYPSTDLRKLTLSFDSMIEFATNSNTLVALGNTVILALVVPTITVILGLFVGYIVIRQRGWIGAVVDYVATFPIAIPGIVFAAGMLWLYVRSPIYGTIFVLIIALVAVYLPHANRFITSGLTQIDPSLEEAAIINGASKLRMFRTIVLPLIKPSALSVWVLLLVFSVRDVNEAVILSGPNSRPLSVLAFGYMGQGYINAVAVVGFMLTLVIILGIVLSRYILGAKLDTDRL